MLASDPALLALKYGECLPCVTRRGCRLGWFRLQVPTGEWGR